jgi:hypothetical protein
MARKPLITLAAAVLATLLIAAPASAARTSAEIRSGAAAWAERQIGVRSNNVGCGRVVNRWVANMGIPVPPCWAWCGAFVHAAFLQAGVRLDKRMLDPEKAYDDAVHNRRHLRRIPRSQIRRGDVVLFAYERGKKASHFGIVTRTYDRNGFFESVEGNNGNSVVREPHRAYVIALALRVVRAP